MANKAMLKAVLESQGFDRCRGSTGDGVTVGCSQCAALVINGLACHEQGCPNAKHECAGCNNVVPRNVKYCQDCS